MSVIGVASAALQLSALLVVLLIVILGPSLKAFKDEPNFAAAGARLQRLTQIDLVLFLVVFTCMILMRFGV